MELINVTDMLQDQKKDLESIIKFTQLAYLPYRFSYQGRAKTEAGDSYTLLKQGY